MWVIMMVVKTITDLERMRDQNLRAMYGAWDCIKNVEKAYPTHDLVWAAFISGMRESRRLLGDVIYSQHDLAAGYFQHFGFYHDNRSQRAGGQVAHIQVGAHAGSSLWQGGENMFPNFLAERLLIGHDLLV